VAVAATDGRPVAIAAVLDRAVTGLVAPIVVVGPASAANRAAGSSPVSAASGRIGRRVSAGNGPASAGSARMGKGRRAMGKGEVSGLATIGSRPMAIVTVRPASAASGLAIGDRLAMVHAMVTVPAEASAGHTVTVTVRPVGAASGRIARRASSLSVVNANRSISTSQSSTTTRSANCRRVCARN